jgi:uncharacterized protein (TIGR03083 family)
MDHREHCAALEEEIDRFADVLAVASPDAPVPGCPDWSVADLALHLGSVHRWAEHLVRVAAPAYQSPDSMNLDRGPVNSDWIRSGGSQLLRTLRTGDPDQSMWAWGPDQHLRWWSRRQLHETLLHRMDVDLAGGHSPTCAPEIAVDAIDEFLANLKSAAAFSPKVRELRGSGQVLRVTTSDAGANWSIRLGPDGFDVVDEMVSCDAAIEGSEVQVLLVLYRRLPFSTAHVSCSGNLELIDFWLEHSALE